MIEERMVGSSRALSWALEVNVGDPTSKLMLVMLAASCGTNVVQVTEGLIDRTGIEKGDLNPLDALLDLQEKGLIRLHAELLVPEPKDRQA